MMRMPASHEMHVLPVKQVVFHRDGLKSFLFEQNFEAEPGQFVLLTGAVGDMASALYFSTISYAAIGYSDVHISPDWRLVGAIEGINGLLLLGWSTAFFVAVVTRLGRR